MAQSEIASALSHDVASTLLAAYIPAGLRCCLAGYAQAVPLTARDREPAVKGTRRRLPAGPPYLAPQLAAVAPAPT
jgi:hypothetical protein